MTGKELARETAKRTGYSIAVCNEILAEMWKTISDELEGHGSVKILEFGVFEVLKRKSFRYFNPKVNKVVESGDFMFPRFKPSKILKEKVKH